MRLGAKLAAVAMAVALLGQPLAAASVCWQMAPAEAACPGRCPMPQKPAHPNPVKASASDPGCCEISSSEPTPPATVAVNLHKAPAPDLTPVNVPVVNAELSTAPVAKESPPLHPVASLNTLYCVFLI